MANSTHDMVTCSVFDVWSGDYDEDVRLTDENNDYPFAGYKKINEQLTHIIVIQNTDILYGLFYADTKH